MARKAEEEILSDEDPEEEATLRAIRRAKKLMRQKRDENRHAMMNNAAIPRSRGRGKTVEEYKQSMQGVVLFFDFFSYPRVLIQFFFNIDFV